jgi:hypothetical protein
MTYKVLFCGDREWGSRTTHPDTWRKEMEAIYRDVMALKNMHPDLVIVHGAARGADTAAGVLAGVNDVPVEEFPAYWNCQQYEIHTGRPCYTEDGHAAVHGRPAGVIRNQRMLDEGRPNEVYAYHSDLAASKGTKDMVRRANEQGIPVILRSLE